MALHEAITLPDSVEDAGGRIPLADVESAPVREAIAYWKNLCGTRRFPARTDVSPREMRGFLRNVCLLRVIDGGADYEYRILGDAHVLAYGISMQGRRLSDVDVEAPDHGPVLRKLYDRVVRKGEPYALRGWIVRDAQQKKYIYSESLFAPLGDGDTVDHVFNASVYVPRGE
ncbi:MAG TPA: PAS domain-containing protein [Rhizomicrobium sp.]|jgi:hypothetical protein